MFILLSLGIKVQAKTQPTPYPLALILTLTLTLTPNRTEDGETLAINKRVCDPFVCIELRNFTIIADDDSQVQTALRYVSVKNSPEGPTLETDCKIYTQVEPVVPLPHGK